MKFVKTAALAAMVAATSATSFAEGRAFNEIYEECGLGGMLFPEIPVAAIISNVIWDLGTTAVSSELSSADSCAGGSAAMAAFVTETHEQLAADLSVGEGVYVASLVNQLGCSNQAAAVAALRNKFATDAEEFAVATDARQSEILFNNAASVAASCTI